MVEASTVPCGLTSTTTTFAIGLPAASLTRPLIVTVARGALSIFSTGEVASEGWDVGAGVGSGVGAGDASGVGAGVSGVRLPLGSGVTSGDGVGAGEVEAGSVAGVSGEAVGSGVAVAGVSGDGDASGDGDCSGVGNGAAASGDGVGCGVTGETDSDGVAAGVLSGDGVGSAGWAIVLSVVVTGAFADRTSAGPIRWSSPSREPLIF